MRGIAALLVLAQHILSLLGAEWATAIVTTVDLGKLGVSLFFLISGFVIPFSFQRGLVGFAIGRAARLLPALWLSMLFAIALGADVDGVRHLIASGLMLTHLLSEPGIISAYWTLNWELYFYAICAGAFALGVLRRPRVFGILAIALGFLSIADHRFSYLLLMFTGTLLRMVFLDKNEEAKAWLFAALGATLGAAFVWGMHSHRPPEFFTALALALPAFVLLWNRLSHPALLWLGSISYSLYLFHLPILEAIQEIPPLPFAVLGIGLPLMVASAVFRWVEQPAMRWAKTMRPRPARLAS